MIFASPLDTPEGPVCLPDGSWLCVEMGPDRGCVTRVSPDGRTIQPLAKTGRPNGLAVDYQGTIWVAESKTPALLKMTPAGDFETFLTGCGDELFIFPNDLAFGPDGWLYMTDSGINTYQLAPTGTIRTDYLDLRYDGRVYRVNTQSGSIEKLDQGILFTNGIAFGPDGSLYVNETVTGNVYRYVVQNGGISTRQLFANVRDPSGSPGWRGPDGMKFGQNGLLYCTVYGQGDVTVLNPDGSIARRIPTAGKFPTNLAFGPNRAHKIYVTEVEQNHIEYHEVGTAGLTLFDGSN